MKKTFYTFFLSILISNNYFFAGNSFCIPSKSEKEPIQYNKEPDPEYERLNEVLQGLEELKQIAEDFGRQEKQYEESNPLYKSIRDLNLESLKNLIENGVDVNAPTPNYAKPLNVLQLKFHKLYCGNNSTEVFKSVLKILLINGAKLIYNFSARFAKRHYIQKLIELLNKARKEIINEYSQKIKQYDNILTHNLLEVGWAKDLPPTVQEYLIPKYNDEQILENIMYIRYILGELSPIQVQNFEKELKENHEHAAVAQAAARAK